jgi:hypothetical protein
LQEFQSVIVHQLNSGVTGTALPSAAGSPHVSTAAGMTEKAHAT